MPSTETASITRPEAWAAWLRGQLKERGLSQESGARELDVTLGTRNRWCQALREPKTEHMFRILKVWGSLPDLSYLATLESPTARYLTSDNNSDPEKEMVERSRAA
jgi:transcriptional regulator with XRE-family HTH domain